MKTFYFQKGNVISKLVASAVPKVYNEKTEAWDDVSLIPEGAKELTEEEYNKVEEEATKDVPVEESKPKNKKDA